MKKALLMIGIGLMALAPLVIVGSVAWTMTLPRMYEAEAKVSLREDADISHGTLFLQPQFEIIQSRQILYKVISNLDLCRIWGKKYNENKEPISQSRAFSMLSGALRVQRYRDTDLISIQVRMEDGRDAALIANEIAKVYREHRLSEKHAQVMRGVEVLEGGLEEQQEKVNKAEAELARLRHDLKLTASDSPPVMDPKKISALQKAERTLETERAVLAALKARLSQAGIELEIQRSPVEIIDTTVPSNVPVSPNLFFNVALSAVVAGIIFLSGLILVIVALVAYRRKPLPALPSG